MANELYQYSVVSALMDGVASDGLPLSDLLARGDHGLGTVRHMCGELIILDGVAYQMRHDGTVVVADAATHVVPFAQITRFQPSRTTSFPALAGKHAVDELLARLCPAARNAHVAFRIDGVFRSVTVRTAEGQQYDGEMLKDVAARQVTRVLGPERGTAIGFRSPEFLQGVSVAGVHMHFINDERTRGGHVLAIETEGDVDVKTAELWRSVMDLPKGDEQFNEAKLERDSVAIQAVEG